MAVGNKIKELRKKQKITQKQLAEMTGIAEITIRQYEANKYIPKIANLQKISSALNINIGEFLDTNQPLLEYYTENKASISNTLIKNDSGKTSLNTQIRVHSSQTTETPALNELLQNYFSMLNYDGKMEAIKRISELAALPQYTVY